MGISVIVGLGNPGRKYDGTRHNVGFMLLDQMADKESLSFQTTPKFQAHVSKLSDGALLVKPQTFMNLSGRTVGQIVNFYKLDPEQVLVVYDDVSLPLGHLRFRERGSAGGHNGIKSIIDHLGTNGFPRLKLGIGAAESASMTGHVLGRFRQEEAGEVENMLATACEAVQFLRLQGIALASNQYNTARVKPKPEQPTEENENEPKIRRISSPDNEESGR